jgi:sialate O-acetylesterase
MRARPLARSNTPPSLKGIAMRIQSVGFVLALMICSLAAQAQSPALLNAVLQDHAVLQRDRPIAVWGRAAAGELVTVSLASASAHAQADASGRWSALLPAMPAGGPFVLTAQGSTGVSQSANDVLVGDVFLCSGQSNMELDVLRAGDSRAEISNAAHSSIRMLTVDHAASPAPLQDFVNSVTWQIASSETVPEWSAVCYFFARELQTTIQVPIGLLHSSWGGANIRPWMSAAALHANGGYESALKILHVYAKDQSAAQAEFAATWEQWWRSKSADQSGAEPWSAKPLAAASNHTAPWKIAPAGLGDWRTWGVPELQDFTGLLWYRTRFTLTAAQAKSAGTLVLGAINQVDQTWINGRAVGNTFGYGTERTYSIAAGTLRAGDNVLVVNVLSTYGGGGLLGGPTTRVLQLANGESIPLEAAWQYRVVPPAIGYPPRAPWESVGGLSTLYNAMIAPLGAYGIRGVLWYQGESNTGEAQTYQSLLTGLMMDWRRQFGAELPFLIVQLPNFGPAAVTPVESDWADVREAQRLVVAQDLHAGLAVTIDIGDAHNLHPTNKQDVGRRLARAARHVIYGESIAPSGPVALSATRTANEIAVEFGDLERGLVAYSHDSPIGFELCADSPGSCRFAQSRIDGARIMLSIAAATSPSRVRYCWADSPVCTLFDRSGFPAGPFELKITR